MSDIKINSILFTSNEKIIKVTKPNDTSYNQYIKIDSPTETWNSV